jgi:hypothetical protein
MNLKPQANLFLTVYFALLAGHVHLATIVKWRDLAQSSLDWRILSLLMTCFWVSHFLVALFPARLSLRIFSCVSLYFVWKETSAFYSWGQFLYFYVHILVSLAPELALQTVYKMKFLFANIRSTKLICFGFLSVSIFYILTSTQFHIRIEWLYLFVSLVAVILMNATHYVRSPIAQKKRKYDYP